MEMGRRGFLVGAGGFVVSAALGGTLLGCAQARPMRVLVATAEAWGTYHIAAMLGEAKAVRGELALVVPDRSEIAPDDRTPVVMLDQARDWRPDLLVVNGAAAWTAEVAKALPDVPVVGSSFTYQVPREVPEARLLRSRLVGATASAKNEAEAFAVHWGIQESDIRVVGNPALDNLPQRKPREREILIATSVTYADLTGGAAPGATLLLDVAGALAALGYRLRIGLHPREDPKLWADFEVAQEATVDASATAEAVVGIPGSVFPRIAAIGTPLVGVTVQGTEAPDYVLDLCQTATDIDSVVAAVEAKKLPDTETLENTVGPLGGSARRLWETWTRHV